MIFYLLSSSFFSRLLDCAYAAGVFPGNAVVALVDLSLVDFAVVVVEDDEFDVSNDHESDDDVDEENDDGSDDDVDDEDDVVSFVEVIVDVCGASSFPE